jgi:hypothetical protein
MSTCPQCGAKVAFGSHTCAECGATVPTKGVVSAIFTHIPHPRIALRKQHGPVTRRDMLPSGGAMQRFNTFLAMKITGAVGTMWCAYAFALLALRSLPDAISGGTAALIAWIAQTFLQLVLLSIIIVGQKVEGAASDKRSSDTYNDAEAILHEAIQIQEHLAAQDKVLTDLIDKLQSPKPA